jgi:hypothetical protein
MVTVGSGSLIMVSSTLAMTSGGRSGGFISRTRVPWRTAMVGIRKSGRMGPVMPATFSARRTAPHLHVQLVHLDLARDRAVSSFSLSW